MRFPVLKLSVLIPIALLGAPAWDLAAADLNSGHGDFEAVYELDEKSIDWSPVKGLIIETHKVIRVNRLSASDVGRIRIWDTFFQSLKSLKGEVRDTTGRVLFTVGMPEVRPIAPFSGFRLYSGDVIRAVDLVAPQAPYVVDVSWTVEIENAFFWPDWIFEDPWPRIRARYSVATPHDRSFRFREAATGLLANTERQARRNVMSWELLEWKPDVAEGLGGPYPLLYAAPEEFRVGRLKGRTDSWDALGDWYWSLTRDQLKLRVDQTFQVEQQIKNKVGDRAIASALKDWVSDQWRYVAIEVGLGGWRPGLASDVYDNKYGDCKDVVFLWIAMMRHAGLDAKPALVRARNPLPIDPEFPKDWFDHVIAMTIINGDTLWADLSDSRYPLGTLPRSCESRWALVVDEDGGELMATPSESSEANELITVFDGTLNADGDLDFVCRIRASGHFARRLPLHGTFGPQLSAAIILGISTPALDASIDTIEAISSTAIRAILRGKIRGWALAGPRQIVLRPRLGGWVVNDTLGGRPDPARVEFPQIVTDSIRIRLAAGWIPEFWPEQAGITRIDGAFAESRQYADGVIAVVRSLRTNSSDRDVASREGAAELGSAYGAARNAEWLFKRESGAGAAPEPVQPEVSRTVAPPGASPANGATHDSLGDAPPQSRFRGKSAP